MINKEVIELVDGLLLFNVSNRADLLLYRLQLNRCNPYRLSSIW